VHDGVALSEKILERQFFHLGELGEPAHHAERTILRRAEVLVELDLAAGRPLLEHREVRERAADVDADAISHVHS
jgi:hypothetical protein